ncbi:MAG TPA: protein YgfX [Burkholderiales bacterium]|nr:protein YgfX [Burkholderiales bacterium]
MKEVPDVHLALAPSRLHVAIAVVGGGATIALMLMLPLPWWCKGAVVVFCVAAAALEVRNAQVYGRARIALTAQRTVTIIDGAQQRSGQVLDASYVSGAFTSIVWRPDDSPLPRTLPLAPDAIDAEDARRTRVLLRYGRSDAGASDGPAASPSTWLKGDMAT